MRSPLRAGSEADRESPLFLQAAEKCGMNGRRQGIGSAAVCVPDIVHTIPLRTEFCRRPGHTYITEEKEYESCRSDFQGNVQGYSE